MIIAVNTRILSGNTAIKKLLLDCFTLLASAHPDHEFIFIGEKDFAETTAELKNIRYAVILQQSNNPLLWKFWYNYKLSAALKKYKADVLISADGTCSLRTKLPQLLIVNDLCFLHHSEWYPQKYVRFIRASTLMFLNKAKRTVVFSQQLKDELQQHYKIAEKKISLLYAGPDKKYQPINWDTREQIKAKYAHDKEYFLFNGAIHKRSSLVNLLKAFSLFKKRQKSNMQLLIVADNIPEKDEFIESIKLYKYRSDIQLLVANETELSAITAAAYAAINLSPLHTDMNSLLNSMQCKVPVIAGNTALATELLGDAALYATASDINGIAENMMLLFKDENKRNSLIEKGWEQCNKYNMDTAATQLWEQVLASIQSH